VLSHPKPRQRRRDSLPVFATGAVRGHDVGNVRLNFACGGPLQWAQLSHKVPY